VLKIPHSHEKIVYTKFPRCLNPDKSYNIVVSWPWAHTPKSPVDVIGSRDAIGGPFPLDRVFLNGPSQILTPKTALAASIQMPNIFRASEGEASAESQEEFCCLKGSCSNDESST
jgi:hypothetical protein